MYNKSNGKKLLTILIVAVMVFTITACNVKVEKKSSTDEDFIAQTSSVKHQGATSYFQTPSKTSTNSIGSSSAEVESSKTPISVHKCTFDQMVATDEYLAKTATYLDGGAYYYSCTCGKAGSETFETTVLDYDYSQIESYINMILTEGSYNNPFWNTEKSGSATWNYIDGCMMTSFMKLYESTKDEKYWDFVNSFMNYLVKADGTMIGYSSRDYNLDNINEGRVLFTMLGKKPNSTKYKTAIETLYSQLKNQPQTSLKSFWHKKQYTNQVWLDGLYMAQPFYATYIIKYGDGDLSHVMTQFENVEKYMKDGETGLYYHGFDNTKSIFWANSQTGLSQNYWLRAMGWYFASLSDLTSIIDKNNYPEEWATIQSYLKGAVDAVIPYMDEKTHMFYQVVDKGYVIDDNNNYNYLETSGTALISYAILNGVNTGALDESYWNVGKSIFNGICINKLKTDKDGNFVLTDICKVAGLGPANNPKRDGSLEYYLSEPIVENEAKGVAPFLMAYVELLRGQK